MNPIMRIYSGTVSFLFKCMTYIHETLMIGIKGKDDFCQFYANKKRMQCTRWNLQKKIDNQIIKQQSNQLAWQASWAQGCESSYLQR